MNISLRRGEKIYINGAVLRVDRKVCIELLNDVTFLLENYVLQADDAGTPLKQLYFVIQMLLMCPNDTKASVELYRSMMASYHLAIKDARIIEALNSVEALVDGKRYFEALKTLRSVFPAEAEILAADGIPGVSELAKEGQKTHAA